MGLTRVPAVKPGVGEQGIFRGKRGLALQHLRYLSILRSSWLQWEAMLFSILQDEAYTSCPRAAWHISVLPIHKHPTVSSQSGGLPTYFKRHRHRNASQGWGLTRSEGWARWSEHQASGLHTPCPVHSQRLSSGTSKTSSLSPPHPPKPEGAEGRPCQTASPEAFVTIHSAHPLGAEGRRGLLCCCFAAQKGKKRQLLLSCWYSAEVGCPSREATWATETTNIPSGSSPKLAANLLQAYGQSIVMFKSLHLFLRGELVSLF